MTERRVSWPVPQSRPYVLTLCSAWVPRGLCARLPNLVYDVTKRRGPAFEEGISEEKETDQCLIGGEGGS